MKTVSLIIPVFNAEKYLPGLFACLDQCDFQPGDEIFLVDNGSTDASGTMCAEKAQNPLYHALRYTDKADSYAARNHALQFAKGDILAFMDSDCKPIPTWLQAVRSNAAENTVVAGHVELEIVQNNLWEHYDSITHLGQSRRQIQNGRVATANMAVNREDFFKVGKFEERFSGGDYEWSTRAQTKGLTVKYCPDARVYHPSRSTYEQTLTKEKRIAYGVGKSYKNNGKSGKKLAIIYFLKIFKIDTNIRITRQLKERKVSFRDRVEFNKKFFAIRWEQLHSALNGYRQVDARSLGIK